MKTLIMGALDEEIDGIYAAMKDRRELKAGAFTVYSGKLYKEEILLCRCGIGKVNSAAATSAALSVIGGVNRVINTGVAGGIGKGIKRGDVVLGTRTVQYDFDATADGKRKGQIEGFDSEFFDGDTYMIEKMERALSAENIPYHKGIIASGDKFIADNDVADGLNAEFGAISCEMESAAIAQVCALYGVPFLAMRAISDNGGDGAVESFYEFLHRAANNNARAINEFFRAESEL